MNNRSAYSRSFQEKVISRFDALDERAVRMSTQLESLVAMLNEVVAGVERESSALAVFRADVGEIRELTRRVEERLTATA